MNIYELQCQLQYYVIDADVCVENNYTLDEVITSLYNDIKQTNIDLFTPQSLMDDIILITKIYEKSNFNHCTNVCDV